MTPNSSGSGLLSAAEFLKRADPRVVGDLCSQSDDEGRIPADQLPTNAVLLAALLDAQGIVEAAVMRGARYQPADLAALTGAGQTYLFRLLRGLTMLLLYQARDETNVPERYAKVMEEVERLADGGLVFGLNEAQQAGLMSHHQETQADVCRQNLLTGMAKRFFPVRKWEAR